MYCYDDFYNEPSEFEQQIFEFKEALMKSVKKEYVEKLDTLEKENAKLQGVKEKFEIIKAEYQQKKNELETEKRMVASRRISDLIKGLSETMYCAEKKSELIEKCDKCDEQRLVSFVSPLGKEMKERCTCQKYISVFMAEERKLLHFYCEERSNNFRIYFDDGDDSAWHNNVRVKTIYDKSMAFKTLKNDGLFFKSKEDCQKYCDYLTKEGK